MKKCTIIMCILVIFIFNSFIKIENNIDKSDINNIYFYNPIIKIVNKNSEINIDYTKLHIILYIVFKYSTGSEYIDSTFYDFELKNIEEISKIRDLFKDYVNKNLLNYNLIYFPQFLNKNNNEIDNENNIETFIYYCVQNFVEHDIVYYNIENGYKKQTKKSSLLSGEDINLFFNFVLSNYNIILKLINDSNIYDKINGYLKNFIFNYDLNEVIYDFLHFYYLKNKDIKFTLIYTGNINIRGTLNISKTIVLTNVLSSSKISTQIIFIHELAHFYDINFYNPNFINIKYFFQSIHLKSNEAPTEKETMQDIKDFLNRHLYDPDINIELIADLSSIFFYSSFEKYSMLYKEYFKWLQKLEVCDGDIIKISEYEYYIPSKVIYPEDNLYIELINYFIFRDNELKLRNLLFNEDKNERDEILQNLLNEFVQHELDSILMNGKWIIQKTIYYFLNVEYNMSKNI